MKITKKAFSIIEVMFWIFIFTLWLVSVYMIIDSTFRINDYNKNYIIATWLAREQVELVRNIRDSNYEQVKKYNIINPSSNNYNDIFLTWSYYKIENNNSNLYNFPIKADLISDFWEWVSELTWKMENYRLCLDSSNTYIYCNWDTSLKKTFFYRYIYIDEVYDVNWVISDSFKIKSKVIWYRKWYHEFDVSMIITDWRRI